MSVENKSMEELSDDEFLQSAPPVVDPNEQAAVVTAPVAATTEVVEGEEEEEEEDLDERGEAEEEEEEIPAGSENSNASGIETGAASVNTGTTVTDPKTLAPEASATAPTGAAVVPGAKPQTGEEAQAPVVNYEAAYKKIMAPFRANGRLIDIRNEDEAIQLMQQGANYTWNMQNIRHHKKTLLMLEQHGLLDVEKISYLIDLSKGDKSAVQKLLKEKEIDPLDINTREEPTYQSNGNHAVSDESVVFNTALEELSSAPGGTETIKSFASYDQASKDILWDNPEVMSYLHEHRTNGTYKVIVDELERRRSIGNIPAHVPFLQAYKAIGEELSKAQGTQSQTGNAKEQVESQTPVIRKAKPKTVVTNGAKATAAAPSRPSSRRTEELVNPLALSDDEFEKRFNTMKGRI